MASTSATPMDSVMRRQWSFDVFLSFRGEDTRNTFLGHLRASLRQKGINTFIDDEKLERGEHIAPALLNAIEASRIAIVVFSENYASSSRCLDELSKIVECSESIGQTLFPIFYNVEPSYVRKQTGPFGTALEEHERRFKDNPDKTQKWRDALFAASNFAGEHFENGTNEAQFVEKIALVVSRKIDRPLLHVAEHPVGLDPEIEKLQSLLMMGSPEVRVLGVCGIGGVGKTTLAKAVYNSAAESFEGCSFLANVRERSGQYNGIVEMQKELLSSILRETVTVADQWSGIISIRTRLENRRCLIVLDDVDHSSQIEALAGSCDWFGSGSRIIVTTRDEHLLVNAESVHRMGALGDDYALRLLSWSAFRVPYPPRDYVGVSLDVVNYAKGLPLALKVSGSFLQGRSVSEWELTTNKLKEVPNGEISRVLKVGFDGLSEDEKDIFLYIVCFFKGIGIDHIKEVLNSCGFHTEIGIRVLVERSLLTSSDGGRFTGNVEMHDLIEEMGRDIVRRESQMPGHRSRLWCRKDIRHVLEESTGADAIRGIFMERVFGSSEEIHMNPKAFEKMKRLQILIVSGGYDFSCCPDYLPTELRWLDWDHYPFPSLPSNFPPKNLVAFEFRNSSFRQLWDGYKSCSNQTTMRISWCWHLNEIPDVSGMPNLEKLNAEGCCRLVKVHESVGFLKKLVYLRFHECSALVELPAELILPSLQQLHLVGCDSLEMFPDISEGMERLEQIHLSRTQIKELPSSIENLTGLQTLYLDSCSKLEAFTICNIFETLTLGLAEPSVGSWKKEKTGPS